MSKVEYGIYKLSNQNKISADINIEVLHQRIKLADVLFRAREAYSLIGKKSALMWWVISFGKAKMYYVKDSLTGGGMIHYSVCIRSKWKFPLLQNDEYEIGPCYTEVAYRGKRIYSKVLSTIIQVEAPLSPVMLINRDNTSSIKGVECIGFEKIGNAWRTKLLKRYRSVNDSEL